MIIVNKKLLAEFRAKKNCEVCGRKAPATGLDPDHLYAKGLGGGRRLDIKWNLVASCRRCHNRRHDGSIDMAVLFGIVARREGVTTQKVVEYLQLLRRLPKGSTQPTEPTGSS